MSRYHVGFTTAAAAAGAAFFDIRSSAADRVRVLEIGLFSTTATAAVLTLERSTTLGTASTSVLPQAGAADTAATVVVGTAWSAAPASTSVPLRSLALPANLGAGLIWVFEMDSLIIPASSSLVVFNRGAAAGPVCRGYLVLDE